MDLADRKKRLRDNPHRARRKCEVRLDRVGINAGATDRQSIRSLPGFRCVRSHFLRTGAYQRVLELNNAETGTTILFYDRAMVPWVAKAKFMLIANDKTGLQPAELLAIFELVPDSRLFLVELAFDFDRKLGVTLAFVLAHALFGKSRFRARKPGILWFGTRRSAKLVRAYWKPQIAAFRVELELHSSWLRTHAIRDLFDFSLLPSLIVPRHILFCRVNWDKVSSRLLRVHPNHSLAVRNLFWQRFELHATLSFIRDELAFPNARRFLIPLATNRIVANALNVWAQKWPKHAFYVNPGRKSRPTFGNRMGVR